MAAQRTGCHQGEAAVRFDEVSEVCPRACWSQKVDACPPRFDTAKMDAEIAEPPPPPGARSPRESAPASPARSHRLRTLLVLLPTCYRSRWRHPPCPRLPERARAVGYNSPDDDAFSIFHQPTDTTDNSPARGLVHPSIVQRSAVQPFPSSQSVSEVHGVSDMQVGGPPCGPPWHGA